LKFKRYQRSTINHQSSTIFPNNEQQTTNIFQPSTIIYQLFSRTSNKTVCMKNIATNATIRY